MSEFSKILNTFHGQNYISNFRVGFCVGEKTVLWALNWILNRLKGWIYEYIQWSKKEWEKEAFDIWTSSSTYELHMVSSKFFLFFFVWKFLKILYFLFSVGIDIPDYISSGGKSDALKSLSERMKNFGRK